MPKLREKEVNFSQFRNDVDSWIKKINSDVENFKELPSIIDENINNTQHNYEIVRELRDEIDELKEELRLLKTVQVAMIRQKMNES